MKKSIEITKKDINNFIRKRILKLILIVITILIIAIKINAQTVGVSISLKDTTVEAIINEIRNQTDQDFVYNHEELSKCPKVSVTIVDGTIEEALKQCLENTDMSFKKVNNTIVIIPVKDESNVPVEKPLGLTQTLRGTVIDRDSKVTLPFANVVILNSNPLIGTITDMDGIFKIEDLPVGRHSLKASFMGYEDAILSEILIGSAKEVIVTIEISEKLQALGEIKVTARKGEPLNQMALVSAQSFSVEETKRYAASISDPARMAQTFAGVSGNDDVSNEIVIRGNSPNWLLWRLEGVEIPSPNHFAEEGYTSGAISILSTNMIGKSDFYTGAFPAEYGDALSGVFDIKLRKGNNEKTEFTVQAGLLGVDLSAEGPFKKGYNGSYLFNYRYSTLSILNDLNVQVSENVLPNYQDLSFKINLPTKKAGIFSIWSIGGLSDADEKYLPDTTLGQYFKDGYSDYTKAGMYAAGISHVYFPNQKSYFKTVIAQSLSYSSNDVKMMDSLGILKNNIFDELKNRALRFTSYYNNKISSRLTMRTGITLNNLNYDYLSQFTDSSYNWINHMNSKGSTNLIQGFLQTKYKFSDNIIFTAGIHYAHFALSNDNSIEPRLGLILKLNNEQKLSFGFGMHSKNESLPVYFVEFEDENGAVYLPHKSLKMSRSTHYIASYDKRVSKDVNVKAEAYFQKINNLPVANNPDKWGSTIFGGASFGDTLENIGEGRNYGLELTIRKFFTNDYYFLITSSLFDSKYKPANGEWYNTKYNINYITNFVAGKEFKWGENKLVGLNAKILWSGGKRLFPIDLEASIEEGSGVYMLDIPFPTKGPDYFRIDLGFRVHFFREKTEHVISVDVQNLTNRLNTWAQIYDRENEKIIDYPMAGLIPILNYRIEF